MFQFYFCNQTRGLRQTFWCIALSHSSTGLGSTNDLSWKSNKNEIRSKLTARDWLCTLNLHNFYCTQFKLCTHLFLHSLFAQFIILSNFDCAHIDLHGFCFQIVHILIFAQILCTIWTKCIRIDQNCSDQNCSDQNLSENGRWQKKNNNRPIPKTARFLAVKNPSSLRELWVELKIQDVRLSCFISNNL